MQGEHHDIEAEFPEFRQRIIDLSEVDADFAAMIKRHNELDNEIRKYEELGQPLSDDSLEKMKHERSHLKDGIYKRIRSV